MSELLELAEMYYAVAKDVESKARYALEVAAMLHSHADKLCEENMKQQPASNPEGQPK